jgi:hypothetical protein
MRPGGRQRSAATTGYRHGTGVSSASEKVSQEAFSELAATATPLDLAIDALGTKETLWRNDAAGAKAASVVVALLGSGGDGTSDPAITQAHLEFRYVLGLGLCGDRPRQQLLQSLVRDGDRFGLSEPDRVRTPIVGGEDQHQGGLVLGSPPQS